MSNQVVAFRTRLRPGRTDEYRRVHAAIPEPVAAALRDSGVVSWRIWVDGEDVMHLLETTRGREAMLESMAARGVIDPAWDALVDTLVEPASYRELTAVWSLDLDGQESGRPLP